METNRAHEKGENGTRASKNRTPQDGSVVVLFSKKLAITANALMALNGADMHDAMTMHLAGDWGDVSEEQWKANDQAVIDRGRIFSTYKDRNGVKFILVSELACSMTTILLPEEY